MASVLIVGTLDTKGTEYAFLKERIQAAGAATIVLDAGVLGAPAFAPDISREEVATAAGESFGDLAARRDRGRAVNAMAKGAAAIAARLYAEGKIQAVVSLGGSAGTTIGCAAMRALPVGVPKLMVSTLASGDTRPYVGTKDIGMVYPVVDIAGLNRISARVIANAAAAIAAQANAPEPRLSGTKALVAATMFGVTTPCVDAARAHLPAESFETLVFHATGTGGRAMEDLIRSGFIAGVLDLTTTEWADEIVGGVMPGGPDRLSAAAEQGIPQVVSLGACDMVNFGPRATVPERFRDRRLYVHNENVTLMRTTPEECTLIGGAIGRQLARSTGPAAMLVPRLGVSAIDKRGEVFYDPEADAALFRAVRAALAARPDIPCVELDLHINAPTFGEEAARMLVRAMARGRGDGSPAPRNKSGGTT